MKTPAIVLSIVLREVRTMKKGDQFGFDFGEKKEWKIKRVR